MDRKVVLDMTASNYSGGFLVFKGAPTADSLVTCGPGTVPLRARAGKTYNIMVISDTNVNGGRLVLTLKQPPTPGVHVSLARRGVAFRSGAARIHGHYFCKHSDSAFMSAHLFQRAGRLKIQAESEKRLRCDGVRHRWSARLVSPFATFARGHALASVRITACGFFVCSHDTARRHIHLAWAPRQRSVQPSTTRMERPRPLVERPRLWPGS